MCVVQEDLNRFKEEVKRYIQVSAGISADVDVENVKLKVCVILIFVWCVCEWVCGCVYVLIVLRCDIFASQSMWILCICVYTMHINISL